MMATLSELEGRKFIRLVTYRRDGTEAPTPVWFVIGDGHIFVWTISTSWKVKRLRRNPLVAFAPCNMRGDPLGPYFNGMATIWNDDSSQTIRSKFQSKYGLMFAIDRLATKLGRKKRIFLEIAPK